MKTLTITFVVPGDYRSGGIRVTALMASMLVQRGHRVRIVHPRASLLNRGLIKSARQWIRLHVIRRSHVGWLHTFDGRIEPYDRLDELHFERDEIVFAVGTAMVGDVRRLSAPQVIKVRYNHGLAANMTPEFREAWAGPMDTVTVSEALVPELEALMQSPVGAVVPNGIDCDEYFPAPDVTRNAIGVIYSSAPNKAPRDIAAILSRLRSTQPHVPRVVFGTERRPRELDHCAYVRYPNVQQAREVYSRALVWLVASHSEGMPGVVLEAMACGAVVVSSDNTGSLALIKNEINGLIVARGDIAAFDAAARRLLTDDKLRLRLAQAGLDTVKRLSWQHSADVMESYLHALIHRLGRALPIAAGFSERRRTHAAATEARQASS